MWKFCAIIKDCDIFGKSPNLYYEKKEKKKTLIGGFFSILSFFIIITFLSYFIIRMVNKRDVTFYDTFHYNEKPPSINLNKDNFYGGFALEDPTTYDPFIDATIYYPRAYFKKGKRNGGSWMGS